jgi:RNA polymerase sigma factor (sigma-70 family)
MDEALTHAPLAEALRHKLLSGEQERRLAVRARRGDVAARESLVHANLRLVADIARSHTGRGVALADLFQDGVVGLLEAADRYDPARGTRFSTYATYWVRMRVSRAIQRMQPLRLTSDEEARRRRIHAAIGRLGAGAGDDELAEATGLTVAAVQETRALMARTAMLSLDAPVNGTETPLARVLEDRTAPDLEDEVAASIRARDARALVGRLPTRESVVLRMRFGFDGDVEHTLQETAKALGVCRETVRLTERRTLASLTGAAEAMRL